MKRRFKSILAVVCAASIGVIGFCGTASVTARAETEGFTESGKIWVIGDSIASKHDDNSAENEVPITGWGSVLQSFLPEDVTVVNEARSGRSSRSYTMEKIYKDVMKKVAAGDYMIIQFGHNDEKESPRYTDPNGDSNTEGSYKWYLKTYYIEPCFEKGARVILASSVVRRLFNEDKSFGMQTHEAYAKAMKELAEEYQAQGKTVYFIDTFEITKERYTQLGDEGTKKLHAVIGKGDADKMDDTHYGPYGAVYMASTIAQQLKELGISSCEDATDMQAVETDVATIETNRENTDKFDWR